MLNSKKIAVIFATLILIFTFSVSLALAQGVVNAPNLSDTSPRPSTGLVPCGGPNQAPCEFKDLFILVNLLMNYALWLVTVVLVGVIAYAGYKYIMSRGNPAEVKKTNQMFWLIVKGLVWMLCAWLLVYTISNTFLNPGYTTFLQNN
ncbi:MAG: hypothetical protein WAV11_01750 [Minisyncoccia bacterium]